jgi:hypothetical protein
MGVILVKNFNRVSLKSISKFKDNVKYHCDYYDSEKETTFSAWWYLMWIVRYCNLGFVTLSVLHGHSSTQWVNWIIIVLIILNMA